MVKILIFLFIFVLVNPPFVSAQETVRSNPVIIRVGDAPLGQKPSVNQGCQPNCPPGGNGGGTVQPPPNIANSELVSAIQSNFGVTMRGGWQTEKLRWIFDMMWELKQTNPKFIELIDGEPIELCDCYPNQMSGYVRMHQNYSSPYPYFLVTLTHELGHAIYHNTSWVDNLHAQHDNTYAARGGFTSYGTTNTSENYADMIAWCLHDDAVGSLISQDRWDIYRPMAEQITGGKCKS